uniref:Uncharacterized protein n=1 Tax=Parascaris univalens TaxID=6257 RepID=A0A914ZN58_PARUN
RIVVKKTSSSSKNNAESDSHSQRMPQLPPSNPLMDAPNVSPLMSPPKSRLQIVEGSMVNGQCLCACERHTEPVVEYRNAFSGSRHSPSFGQQNFVTMVGGRSSTADIPPAREWKPWYTPQINQMPHNHDIFSRYYDQRLMNHHMGV